VGELDKYARLAALKHAPAPEAISEVIEWMRQIQNVDTKDVEPLVSPCQDIGLRMLPQDSNPVKVKLDSLNTEMGYFVMTK
jgi:Asp-tRNA(Asn)/Glu-tRNA(Gln) amidotransferase C subunit